MAKAFVRQLPRIPSYALPSDAYCPICTQPYENQTTDSGSFEKAVALPCSGKHIFGSECLLEWLIHGKSCPLCRHGVTLPIANERQLTDFDKQMKALIFTIVGDQDLDDHLYRIFWIVHLNGDPAVESAWQEWQQDFIWAANQWDFSCYVQARAALILSPLITFKRSSDPRVIRGTAAAIQTLRFREYRLFLRFQADAGEHPELKTPPAFQLTPAQEEKLLHELDRRGAFKLFVRMARVSNREKWNMMRDIGFVWDPDWDVAWCNFPGSWSLHAY